GRQVRGGEQALGERAVLPGPQGGGGGQQQQGGAGGDRHGEGAARGDGAEEVQRPGADLGLLEQQGDEGRRAVQGVGRVGQLDGAGEALAQLGVLLLDEGGQGGGVERAPQRQDQGGGGDEGAQAGPGGAGDAGGGRRQDRE